jgi:hypothetical protein
MIVKDEEVQIERCLLSAIKADLRTWVITDTGSTDSTQRQIEHLASEYDVQLYKETVEWSGFADARNANLALTRTVADIDFWLQVDADEVVEKVRDQQPSDADMLAVSLHNEGDGLNIWATRMTKHNTELRWFGKVHEYLNGAEGYPWHAGRTDAYRIVSLMDGYRTLAATRGKQNYDLSQAELAEDRTPRAVFYGGLCAESIGLKNEARELFDERATMEVPGPLGEEEGWFAQLRSAYLLATDGDPLCVDLLMRAYARRPHRTEPLAVVAFYWQAQGFEEMAKALWPALQPWPVNDWLFIDPVLYSAAPEVRSAP